jgi:hypothetical protein
MEQKRQAQGNIRRRLKRSSAEDSVSVVSLPAILMFPFRDASPATHDKQQKTTQATFIALQTESSLAALNTSQGSGASRGPTKRRFNPFS